MKKKGKGAVTGAVFFAVLIALLLGLGRVMEYKGSREKIEPFLQRAQQIDVLFFGDSHAYSDIYPMELWDGYGIAAYNLASYGANSQGIDANGTVYVSGQLAINPATGKFAEGGIKEEARQSLTNIKNILEAAGSSMDKVVKTLVFIKNMDDFGKVNEIYGKFFQEGSYPARSCVEVARLPKDALVEIEVIAEL